MQYERFRKLDLLEIPDLSSKAKQGDPEALRAYVAYALWKQINSNKELSMQDKIGLHEFLMNSVEITFNV